MFCPQCGANNADNAAVCVQCGRNLQAAPPAVQGTPMQPMPIQTPGVVIPPGATVQNYLVFAILVTVFCCLPAGIPAIIYAAQVNSKLQQGDYLGAQQASKNAKTWCLVSVGVFLGGFIIWILLFALGLMGSMFHPR